MDNQFSCIVIGFGSIGKRHSTILEKLGHRVAVVSRREINYPNAYKDVTLAIKKENPDYIIIANETNQHEQTLLEIQATGFDKKILVEKPLYSRLPIQQNTFSHLYVGYNLRFHPLVQALYDKINNTKIISAQAYVGQYLPSWRPGTDYTKSYSASWEKGGGVIRDLSHELDYLTFLFGDWREMVTLGGKFSDLHIESDDHFSFIYSTNKVPLIALQMNYLDHINQRFLIVNTNKSSYKLDFIQNTMQINDKVIQYENERDDTYRLQHLAVLNGETKYLCTYEEGLNIVNFIKKSFISSKEKRWVLNE